MLTLHAFFLTLALGAVTPSETVLLDFYADWCGPCRAMQPTVEGLIQKGYRVEKVNIDRNPELAAKYSVRSVPCYVMVVDGKEVDRVLGGTSFSRLERMCKMTSSAGDTPNSLPREIAERSVPMTGAGDRSAAVPANLASLRAPGEGGRLGSIPVPSNFAARNAELASTSGSFPQTPMQENATNPFAAGDYRSSLNNPVRGAGPSDLDLLSVSVRLRIEDPDGHSCGSGTIIDAREGEALILTCGHIFRDSQGKGKIGIDFFGSLQGKSAEGTLVSYDLTRDIGLVSVRLQGAIPCARIAPAGYTTRKGDAVASVGCSHGADATVRRSQVTTLNKYLGPSNLQVADQPVQGRSGGGLFSAEGYVIGVCNAADPSDQEGLYAAVETICRELDSAGLSFIYNPTGATSSMAANTSRASELNSAPLNLSQESTAGMNDRVAASNLSREGMVPGSSSPLSGSEQAALEEIRKRVKEGAEVICVVRSKNNPEAKSEVIMLDKASPEFLRQLGSEARPVSLQNEGPRLTSFEVTRPRQIKLEWSKNDDGWRQGK